MSAKPDPTEAPANVASRDAAWAQPIDKLSAADVPAGAMNLNVTGRQLAGPLQGFGQLWQKTYRVRLTTAQATPQQVIKIWRENFPKFWPKGNNFYAPLTRIEPGEVAVLNLALPGGMRLSTGVRVIYADDESFTFMTPEGHMYAAMITFSAFEEDAATVAQVQPLIRASDPMYEIGMRLGFAHKMEDQFWHRTLQALAAHFDVQDAPVQQKNTLVDPKLQWKYTKNIWNNAAIRSTMYVAAKPLRWVGGLFRRKEQSSG
ncbi:MAG TPA: hypothetical protein VF478_08830 [Anaerolineae bacterium]